jgi:hypothetical protein
LIARLSGLALAALWAAGAHAQAPTERTDTVAKYVPACLKFFETNEAYRKWRIKEAVDPVAFCECVGPKMVADGTEEDYVYREQHDGKQSSPHELALWKQHSPGCTQAARVNCAAWFMGQLIPSSLAAGPKGAPICESAEAVADYRKLDGDPATRERVLFSGPDAPCVMVPPGERYELIAGSQQQHIRHSGAGAETRQDRAGLHLLLTPREGTGNGERVGKIYRRQRGQGGHLLHSPAARGPEVRTWSFGRTLTP